MTDVHTAEQRSRNMAAIRGVDTKPEIRVRSALHALGYRFRLHRKDLPGKPDIVLPKFRTAIFVHGCFWHSHDCRWGKVTPKTRPEFWAEKRGGTTARDDRKARALSELGWRVLTVWECETRDMDSLRRLLQERLCEQGVSKTQFLPRCRANRVIGEEYKRGDGPLNLDQLRQAMRAVGVTQLWLKRLAENDNSKNQVYLGPDFTALNVLPTGPLTSEPNKPNLLKSALQFSWLKTTGELVPAPGAQLILYPQYPEVRFSGFLKGSPGAPSDVMTVRERGRVLFFGVTEAGAIVGFAAGRGSDLAREVESLDLQPDTGVFSQLAIEDRTADEKQVLIAELRRIAALGWIDSKRLNSKGEVLPCPSLNCGGYTLEAELGIRPNGYADPDFHGWEIKQHKVLQLTRPAGGGPITLMTPEPTSGVYVEGGIKEFMRLYGYPDRTIPDRRNFGGIHSAGKLCTATGLQLTLEGYDAAKAKITDFSRGVSLMDAKGTAAATWHYKDLLSHWTCKHAKAAYIPSLNRKAPSNQYRYGSLVRLAEGTEFRLFLQAVAANAVYYDPGIKIVNASSAKPEIKKRSQFRIKSANIPMLYTAVSEVDVAR